MAGSIGWRVWLGNMPLHAVHLLACDPLLVAVWRSSREVYFFGAHDADYLGKRSIPAPPAENPAHAAWRDFLAGLRAPDGAWLPVVTAGAWHIHTSHDGRLRVLHTRQDLLIEIDGEMVPLAREGDDPLAAVALDRELGTVAVLDARSHLQFFQQALAMGVHTLDGPVAADGCFLALPDAPGAALVADAAQLRLIDTSGQVQQRLTLGAPLSAAAVAPDGSLIVIAEGASMRVLDAALVPLWQASGPELLAALDPVDDDTAAAPVDPAAPVRAAAVAVDGTVAYAVGGTLGVTVVEALEPLPQPRPLL